MKSRTANQARTNKANTDISLCGLCHYYCKPDFHSKYVCKSLSKQYKLIEEHLSQATDAHENCEHYDNKLSIKENYFYLLDNLDRDEDTLSSVPK